MVPSLYLVRLLRDVVKTSSSSRVFILQFIRVNLCSACPSADYYTKYMIYSEMLAIVYRLFVLISVTMIFGEGSKLVERALSLDDPVENAHSERRTAPAFRNLTNIPSQYWNQNQSHQSFPPGLPYPSLQPLANCIHQISCSGLNSQQIDDYSARDEPSRAYCSKHFGYLKRVWRSHDCEFRASACTSELEKAGWKHTNGKYFCKSCSPVKKNLYRHVKNMELISKEKRVMPSSSSIKQHIRGIATESFTQHLKHNEAIKDMKVNEDVLEGMLVLG